MASLNRATLIGHIGQDPELKSTTNGTAVLNFNMATDDGYFDKNNNWVERTEWHRIVVFGDTAERLASRLYRGGFVYVEGRLQTRKWEDEKAGVTRSITEIIARAVKVLDKRSNESQISSVQEPEEQPNDEEDLPF